MKSAVILAGGKGTRISEETYLKPKPMIEIGGKPMLWHIMNIYASHGHKEFLVACGYKGEMIKEYFHRFFDHNSDFVVDRVLERLAREKTTSGSRVTKYVHRLSGTLGLNHESTQCSSAR